MVTHYCKNNNYNNYNYVDNLLQHSTGKLLYAKLTYPSQLKLTGGWFTEGGKPSKSEWDQHISAHVQSTGVDGKG